MYQAHHMPKGRQLWIDPVQVEFEKKTIFYKFFHIEKWNPFFLIFAYILMYNSKIYSFG